MATQEQLDLRAKWVEALRSGKYKQTKGKLKGRTGGFCCLGVLCDVVGVKPVYDHGDYLFDNEESSLPFNVASKIGLTSSMGEYDAYRLPENAPKKLQENNSLANLNDDAKMKFKDIADFIESNPPGLFTE